MLAIRGFIRDKRKTSRFLHLAKHNLAVLLPHYEKAGRPTESTFFYWGMACKVGYTSHSKTLDLALELRIILEKMVNKAIDFFWLSIQSLHLLQHVVIHFILIIRNILNASNC